MYDIGQALGLDKEAARRMGEQLIGDGFLEIISLSGSVSLTEEGRQAADTGSDQSAAGATGPAVAVDAAAALGLSGVAVKVLPLAEDLREQLETLTKELALANRGDSGSAAASSHLTALAGLLVEASVSRGTVRECLTGAALGLDKESLAAETAQRMQTILARLWSDS